MSQITIDGQGITSGLAIATVRIFPSKQSIFDKRLNIEAVDQRIERFQFALEQTKIDVMKIRNYTEEQIDTKQATVFESHLLFLDDKDFINIILERIKAGHDPVEVVNAFRMEAKAELSLMDDYFKGRQADLDDVLFRLVSHMLGEKLFDLTDINDEVIVVLEQLTPSFIVRMHPDYVKGIIVEKGSPYSHTTMLAESLGIPIIRIDNHGLKQIHNADVVILDSDEDMLILRPNAEALEAYEHKKTEIREEHQKLESLKDKPTETHDGVEMKLLMNVNVHNHINNFDASGAEGIGLVRTEMLFNTEQGIPTEEEQFKLYKSILESTDQSVTIRVFDFGGDKHLNRDEGFTEVNPILGTRGVRFLLNHVDVLKSQLRAMIRASKYGRLSILFPFVTSVDEVMELQRIVVNVEHELKDESVEFAESIPIGVMVETPSAVLMISQFAPHCDFFALGTNDLIQYFFAADRDNGSVAKYYDSKNPKVLKMIREAIQDAQLANRPITICGDIAKERTMIPLLIGLGVRSLSMDPKYILKSRALIKDLSVTSLEKLVDKAIIAESGEQVELLVKDYLHYM